MSIPEVCRVSSLQYGGGRSGYHDEAKLISHWTSLAAIVSPSLHFRGGTRSGLGNFLRWSSACRTLLSSSIFLIFLVAMEEDFVAFQITALPLRSSKP
ncbi:hypothetical protein SISSUDRAFT_453488 [Sistotremastrum suecicum HHB10207 ss-3]|uniref:Uncharacterized protein n=1 Tax=Sistotremastrum suecicum HHB10207 ss-3 TaxID=1314776 RepID=A0A165Y8U7_9AGAM|nr:hypothetical protein SISSUDRAFT_453488 [Sistotremastrum suecicum HHB10207 ss-3]